MLIGIDGNEANIQKRVGVNAYAYELLCSIWKLQGEWGSKYSLIVYLKNKPLKDMPEETANFKYKVISGGGMWVLTKLTPSLMFDKNKPDVFMSLSHYVPFFAPMPKVCAIMDLGYLDFSGQFTKKVFWQLKYWTAISILVSKRIIAISNATKDDIVRHYPFSKDKIEVTQLSNDLKSKDYKIDDNDVRRVKNKYSIVDDYILYLGTLKPSKNLEGLISSFGLIANHYPLITLVIAGKKGWLFDSVFKKVQEFNLQKKVIFTDYVSDVDKMSLRRGAKAFIQPSFWEGFGIDTLSAMAIGIPVVVSSAGSLPEVVGDAGIVVDPYNINSIAAGIEKVLSMSKKDYNSMVKRGLIQVKKFSWEKTARETLKIIENAISR